MSQIKAFIVFLLLFVVLPVSILLIRDLVSWAMGNPRRFSFKLRSERRAYRKAIDDYFKERAIEQVKPQSFSSPGLVRLFAFLWTTGWCIALLVVVGILILGAAAFIRTGESVIEDPLWALPLLKVAMVCGVLAILVALFIRCDNCGGHCFLIFRPSVNTYIYETRLRAKKELEGLMDFLGIDLHRKKTFHCPHCHTEYTLNSLG